jgi:hypothetical protein
VGGGGFFVFFLAAARWRHVSVYELAPTTA